MRLLPPPWFSQPLPLLRLGAQSQGLPQVARLVLLLEVRLEPPWARELAVWLVVQPQDRTRRTSRLSTGMLAPRERLAARPQPNKKPTM
jgi:hypothetical protein